MVNASTSRVVHYCVDLSWMFWGYGNGGRGEVFFPVVARDWVCLSPEAGVVNKVAEKTVASGGGNTQVICKRLCCRLLEKDAVCADIESIKIKKTE